LTQRRNLKRHFRLLLAEEAQVAWMMEDGESLEKLGAETMELAREAGDTHHTGLAYAMLSRGAILQRDVRSARTYLDRAMECFSRIGDGRSLVVTYIDRSNVERLVGRAEESIQWLDKVLLSQEKDFQRNIESVVQVNRAEALLTIGPPEDALSAARTGYDLSLAIEQTRYVLDALVALGIAELQNGATEAAMKHLAEAIHRSRGRWKLYPAARSALCWFVEACASIGKPDEASDAARELRGLFAEGRSPNQSAEVCWALARYAESTDRLDEREQWVSREIALVRATLATFDDPADVKGYSRLLHNRWLLNNAGVRRSAPVPRRA
jgi:tetratricopeptide (TPR) repeat protein